MGSTFDRRRINGPEVSFPPVFATTTNDLKGKSKATESVQEEVELSALQIRKQQGRAIDEIRPIFLRTGLIPAANGSAYIETGSLKLACAVYGPRQVRGRQYSDKAELNVEVKYAPFATQRRKKPGKDTESPSLSSQIHSSLLPSIRLDLLPKASLDIYITILEADGTEDSCAAAGTTAASVALADAGIEMFGLVIGVAGAFASTNSTPRFLVDPTTREFSKCEAQLALWLLPALGTVTSMNQSGPLDPEEIDSAMDTLVAASTSIHYVAAKALAGSFAAKNPNP